MSSTSSSEQSNTGTNLPASNREWYQLVQPHIDIPTEDASGEDLCRFARLHAEQVVERVEELEIDLDAIEWVGSERLKASHGKCTVNSSASGHAKVTLSLPSLRRNGWQNMMQTVRHELVHVWQAENDQVEKKYGFAHWHDVDSFERWIVPLSIAKRGPKVCEPRYRVSCRECGGGFSTHRMTLTLRNRIHGLHACHLCGAAAENIDVHDRIEDRILCPEDEDIRVMTQHMRSVYTFVVDGEHLVRRELTDFAGIGTRTVERLGRELEWIGDMVDGRQLIKPLQDIVPSQYHDELWAEARSYADWNQKRGTRPHGSCRPNPADYFDSDGSRIRESKIPPETPDKPTEEGEPNLGPLFS